jgi:hypothetical protein
LDPHLPSAASLIDSFLKDLRGIASIFSGQSGVKPQSSLYFFCAGGATSTWKADASYNLVSVCQCGSIQCALTLDGSGYTTNFAGTATLKRGNILWIAPTPTGQQQVLMKIPIQEGSKLAFTNNSAANACLLCFLELQD